MGMRHASDDSGALLGRLQRLQEMAVSPSPPRPTPNMDAHPATDGRSEPPAKPPTWADTQRGVPNWLLRTSIWGIVRRGRRAWLDEELIVSQGDTQIIYTGERLDMADSTVWDQCTHYWSRGADNARKMPDRIYFPPGRLLREIGRNTGTSDRKWLDRVLDRLTLTSIKIIGPDGTTIYRGQLLGPSGVDEVSGQYMVDLHPDLIALFGINQYTRLDAAQIAAFRGHQTAHWLYRYYASHRDPYPVRPDYLRDLSGSGDALKSWNQRLPGALNRMCDVTGWSWRIERGLVEVTRVPGVWA